MNLNIINILSITTKIPLSIFLPFFLCFSRPSSGFFLLVVGPGFFFFFFFAKPGPEYFFFTKIKWSLPNELFSDDLRFLLYIIAVAVGKSDIFWS